jgi:hypothetical protein
MEEIQWCNLVGMDLKPTLNDLFWKEKTQRMINECNSVSQLREIAILLLTVATQRQGVICGLMKKILLETKGPSLTPGPNVYLRVLTQRAKSSPCGFITSRQRFNIYRFSSISGKNLYTRFDTIGTT